MSISGLVLTLDPATPPNTLSILNTDPRLTLGEANGPRLPVVVDAEDGRASRDVVDELAALEGVLAVDIAFVSFDQPSQRS